MQLVLDAALVFFWHVTVGGVICEPDVLFISKGIIFPGKCCCLKMSCGKMAGYVFEIIAEGVRLVIRYLCVMKVA